MSIERIDQQIAKDLDKFKMQMAQVVGQESISEGSRGVLECAEILAEIHRKAGFDEVEVFKTTDLANVWAYMDAGKEQTLAVYAYFDNASPSKAWKRDPYGAEIGPSGDFPEVMFGHGIGTKGPMMVFLSAVQAMKSAGQELPFNIACLLEGEEFVGSTNYREMVQSYKDRMSPCIGAISASAGQGANGAVSIGLGSKGCAYFELISSGETSGKGPVTVNVHSSAQGVVHSPAWRLVEALNALVKPGSWGLEVAFDGYYDDIHLPEGQEKEMFNTLFEGFKGKDLKKVLPGVAGRGAIEQLPEGLSDEEIFLRLLYYPTFNMSGIRAGYVDIDSPLFSLPGKAVARIDMRFGQGQHGEDLMDKLRAYLDQKGFSDIQILNMGTHDSAWARMKDPIVDAAVRSYEEFKVPVGSVWPTRPAGAPLGDFCTVLAVPALAGVGIGHVGSEGADQFMVLQGNGKVAGLEESIRFLTRYILYLGETT